MLRWRREKMRKRERGEAVTAAFDTRTKKNCGKNKWAIF